MLQLGWAVYRVCAGPSPACAPFKRACQQATFAVIDLSGDDDDEEYVPDTLITNDDGTADSDAESESSDEDVSDIDEDEVRDLQQCSSHMDSSDLGHLHFAIGCVLICPRPTLPIVIGRRKKRVSDDGA